MVKLQICSQHKCKNRVWNVRKQAKQKYNLMVKMGGKERKRRRASTKERKGRWEENTV